MNLFALLLPISMLLFGHASEETEPIKLRGSIRIANMESEDEILKNELAWAENSMEMYKRNKNQMPLRSSIRAAHVHSGDWLRDSLGALKYE